MPKPVRRIVEASRCQLVGDPETRREVVELRLLVRAPAGAVLAGVDDDVVLIVEVGDPVVLLGRRQENLVAQAGIDGQPVVDLEVVLHEHPVLHHPELRLFEQEAARGIVEVAEQHLGKPGAAAVGQRVVDEARAEVDRAARVVMNERRRPAIDEPITELQLVTALQPDQHVLDLVVELARVDRQERRPAGDAGEVRDARCSAGPW